MANVIAIPNMEKSTEDKRLTETLFEQQAQAPAPSQSYHQVVVTKSDVILRTWPKKRISQAWSRDGNMNPSNASFSHDEFLKGELQDQIKHIFGTKTLDKILGIVSSK